MKSELNENELKLLHWNTGGFTTFSNLIQFEYLIERENIHIAPINEAYLNAYHKTYFKNHFIYRNDR